MKIPETLERGKNTNRKNIFQAVFKLKWIVDLQWFMIGTKNEQTYQQKGHRSWSNLSILHPF